GIDTASFENQFTLLAEEGKTPIFVSLDKKIIAIIAVSDPIKETSEKAISHLDNMNIKTIMLTGDNEKTALAIKNKLGIKKFIANVLPQDKEKHIRELQKEKETVAMVGDGINDAPALAASDIGIAIGNGTDIAIESAQVVLMKGDLRDVPTAIKLSKKVITNIKENLFWAFIYNVIGIPVAAGVLYSSMGIKLSPTIAAAAMSFSSVCVVLNALRIKTFKAKKGENNKMKKIIIEGMSCPHCSARVEKILNEISGVSAKVNLEEKTAYVELAENIPDEVLKSVIDDAGYKVVEII
ncbi:MAG: metal-transporting ATPase, partial [Clostridia bacterium]|nr:metal-transporting ATPase [Clostridia bacterium]